jgi:sigma-B regulation protein RsbU (phosphoserine phosphatase)
VSRDGGSTRLEATATVLGMFAAWTCDEGRISMAPGDTLMVFSDGVLECGEEDDDGVSADTLVSLALSNRTGSLRALPDRIVDTVHALSGATPHDDVSVLALRAA